MPKVFVVSLHRSATQSTGTFLRQSGLGVCHWPARVDGVDYQAKVVGIETDRKQIVGMLRPVWEAYDAFDDVPLPVLYRELDEAYPDARFVALYRDPFEWVRSIRVHCRGRVLDPYERVQYWHYLDEKPEKLDDVPDDRLIAMHLRHHEELMTYFRGRGNFMLANLADPDVGKKLSAFLKVPPRNFPLVDYKKKPGNTLETRSRFHILGLPHTVSIPEYNVCAFTQKVVRLCALLKSRGHYVIHYGHRDSRVACDEHVTVTDDAVLRQAYGDHDWRTQGFPPFKTNDHAYQIFYEKTIAEVAKRKEKNDFLLCMFGSGHKPVADEHKDMIVVEPGIGYAGGHFAPFKVFESYAILHAFLGLKSVAEVNNRMWYDAVIPNYFDLNDFEYSDQKDDYFLYLGRVNGGKGVHIAMQIAEATGDRLIIAGPGSIEGMTTRTNRPKSEYVEHIGVADVETRKRLMSKAKAMLLPSTFVEPFCGVHVESMLSGTPVVTTDWGAFTEYNLHGVTGYRCRTFEQFVWAAKNVGNIRPAMCRDWAAGNFSMDRVGEMYDEYFYCVRNQFGGGGWYAENPARTELNWLSKRWPSGNAFVGARPIPVPP
ncbi:MAG TPA: sulfotransferase [Stellaceae bacterium]|jgi:glycosyltransferase involved in cell wall biosynthesis|nr:sulfotransferase [Stellaceae bacterium]